MKVKKVETVFLMMGYFVGFEKYGIDVFYNRKYQKWLIDDSTDAESLNSDNNNFHAEYDKNGFITNAKFTAFHNSIPLTENDFIDIQINRLNTFLSLNNLKSTDKIQVQYFKNYLKNRIKTEINKRQMNYIDIILRGYSNENDRKFLSNHFIREYKKAEKENYKFDEFFNGLLSGIDKIKDQYKTRLYERKRDLYFMLGGAKNGTLKYSDLKDESIEERQKETIEYCESELAEISFENFPLNLLHFTNDRYRGFLNYSEVEFIENEIAKAFEELKKPQQTEPLDFFDTSTAEKILFKNTFDKVDETIVFEFFKTNLVGKKYLSEKVLNNFLSLAFDKKVLPKQKFSFEKLNTQNDVVQIFYNYYKITAGKPYGKQKEYLNLLCNYFNGFENFNIKNFSK